ncbi:hypothetical protein CRG98_023656 [Punica granatum]|uniref:Peptidase A1 domain-containing protein n=1 Tax=Punica granatum TaxID=22663 RepID=A0A2I0JI38_PUNGR|nr:hypothetical protein CRG98_023656 [Punica granatum]
MGLSEHQYHHVLDMKSLVPATTCVTPSTGPAQQYGLPLVHRRGPCSPLHQDQPHNPSMIFLRDKARYQLIASSIASSWHGHNVNPPPREQGEDMTVPVPGMEGDFLVTVGLGSPTRSLTLILDTGCDLTWTHYKTIIDSGTTITRLPQSVYAVLCSAFQNYMWGYPEAPELPPLLDTCYDLEDYEDVKLPRIVLNFEQANVTLDPSGIIWRESNSQVCLAFSGNTDQKDDLIIIGSTQQSKLDILYDVKSKRVGFGRGSCGGLPAAAIILLLRTERAKMTMVTAQHQLLLVLCLRLRLLFHHLHHLLLLHLPLLPLPHLAMIKVKVE